MEILDSSESLLHWDRNLSELSEAEELDSLLYTNHFSELLDDLSPDALLGQLLSDPFLSGDKGGAESMEGEDSSELSPSSPLPPHITAEHSYSLCGDSRPQSPLSHLTGEHGSEPDSPEWAMEQEEAIEGLLCESPSLLPTLSLSPASSEGPRGPSGPALAPVIKEEKIIPEIKLEPHEVDQFLNFSPKGLESPQMPPTPPSSHGSDSEGSQSPVHATPTLVKVSPRAASSLSNSPLLTAPHKLQGSGPLILTEEERRTLVAEGYPVPTKLPLTKAEEKALKKIRRKIKNKISAQESRRKKKEYMDTLEKKVETCSNENNELRRKVETLECTNKSLLQQLQALQAMVAGKIQKSCRMAGTQTSSCLMAPPTLEAFFEICLGGAGAMLLDIYFLCFKVCVFVSVLVKSRSLLSTFEDEQPHLLGLGGEYPEQWEDTAAVIMAAWRRSEQQKLSSEANRAETHPPFRNKCNDTQKNLLLDLNRSQRANGSSSKVLELDRSVNETS
uniref:Cyclic AMP-responsive element-binding protein 3-like protein 2 n=1 Tax=Fundulus heteroclitus TaxID=8078 RepID=A0A3Q2SRR3_FUNHE